MISIFFVVPPHGVCARVRACVHFLQKICRVYNIFLVLIVVTTRIINNVPNSVFLEVLLSVC